MRTIPLVFSLMAIGISAGGAVAQAQAPAGPSAGASAAGPGMGPGRGPGARFGADYTPGWAMMSSKERQEHRASMRNAKTPEECRDLMSKHHQQMTERAKAQGRVMPAEPRRDACAGFAP